MHVLHWYVQVPVLSKIVGGKKKLIFEAKKIREKLSETLLPTSRDFFPAFSFTGLPDDGPPSQDPRGTNAQPKKKTIPPDVRRERNPPAQRH